MTIPISELPALLSADDYEKVLKAIGVDTEKEGHLPGEVVSRLIDGKAAGADRRRDANMESDLAQAISKEIDCWYFP